MPGKYASHLAAIYCICHIIPQLPRLLCYHLALADPLAGLIRANLRQDDKGKA